jgi:hypothetical protein
VFRWSLARQAIEPASSVVVTGSSEMPGLPKVKEVKPSNTLDHRSLDPVTAGCSSLDVGLCGSSSGAQVSQSCRCAQIARVIWCRAPNSFHT